MALLVPTPDYSDKDFDAVRLRLQNLIKSVFPEWTDFNVANFGNILLELFAFTIDILGFYQDNQSLQSRIVTATQREALLGLVKLIGFKPAAATAASATVLVSLPAAPVGTFTLPKGSIISTEEITDPIEYQLLADAIILPGANPSNVSVSAENSLSREDTFTSSGQANQAFVVSNVPFVDGSATLIAGDGVYTQVDSFLSSAASDKHFTVTVDQNDRATFRTGNGINGTIPVGTVTVGYKTGGGSRGRVEANRLKKIKGGPFTDSLGNSVQPTVNNAAASVGGLDRQTIAQIKLLAPEALRTISRSVTKEDFEINARRLRDVARALLLTKNEDPSIAENSGILFVIPQGGGLPTQALKDAVFNQVTVVFPCTLTFSVFVQDPLYKTIAIFAVVFLKQGQTPATVKAAIIANLTAFFAVSNADGTPNTNVDFGANIKANDGTLVGEVAVSDVENAIRDTAGVRKVGPGPSDLTLNGLRDDVELLLREFPKLGTVTLINGDTGLPL